MIRVDWSEVRKIDKNLKRRGFQPDSKVHVHVYLIDNTANSTETKKSIEIKFKEWLRQLYYIESNRRTTSVVITDENQRVIWKIRTTTQPGLRTHKVPPSGHEHIIRDFASMESAQREAWVEMTIAALKEYVCNND